MISDLIHRRDKTKYKLGSNCNIKIFTDDAVKRITRNYSTLIGKGPSGEVYRGILDYDQVAVKRYIHRSSREEFMEVISICSHMSHKNLVKLIGYCIEDSTLIIITEFISRGNLDDILYNSAISIPLDVRLGIAIGCAEALSYIHSMKLSSSDSFLCHSAIKPTNILLDDNLTAKVSDIEMSRLLLGGITQYSAFVRGSTEEGYLTTESDVYSFGAVLLELMARKRVKRGDINLIVTFRKVCEKRKGLMELFDTTVARENDMKTLKEMGKLAMECLALDIHKRPQMSDVVKRLRVLKKVLKERHAKCSESILATHLAWSNNSKQDISMPRFISIVHIAKGCGIFMGNRSNSNILSELGSLRIFTKVELNDITQNFSDLLYGGTSAKVYKGTLEDNTVIAVKKFFEVLEDFKEAFINGGIILSQLVHKNIVKLVGCCLDADTTPIFVYEYAAKGSLSDVLDGQEDFPLHLRVKIAIQTAEALEYLHSSSTGGVIRHGYIVPSKILLDNNFLPKLTGFSGSKRLVRDTKINSGYNVISSCLPTDELYTDAILDQCAQLKVKTDVYQFGVLLLVLISRKNFMSYADHHHLIFECIAAYEAENSGKAFFDVDIGADEEIFVLEEIGRLALKCASMEVDERPTMKEVAEHLRIIGRSWKPTFGIWN
ncbi:unnamed protein product [Urochloa decumbens]|uniref:Protein kinase domain-containing protein n=1 Tax=Urochloa decumbens TaxID=240449 RepID=A0ABC9B237_9POAL